MLEGFTTFMDCCLRTRTGNVVRNESWRHRLNVKKYFVELHSSQWLSSRILNTPAHNIILFLFYFISFAQKNTENNTRT